MTDKAEQINANSTSAICSQWRNKIGFCMFLYFKLKIPPLTNRTQAFVLDFASWTFFVADFFNKRNILSKVKDICSMHNIILKLSCGKATSKIFMKLTTSLALTATNVHFTFRICYLVTQWALSTLLISQFHQPFLH